LATFGARGIETKTKEWLFGPPARVFVPVKGGRTCASNLPQIARHSVQEMKLHFSPGAYRPLDTVRSAMRLFLPATLLIGLFFLVDVAMRFEEYERSVGNLWRVSGPVKLVSAYGLVGIASILLLTALLWLPAVGRWLAAFLACVAFSVNMSFQHVLGNFIQIQEVRTLPIDKLTYVKTAVTSYLPNVIAAYFEPQMLLYGLIGVSLGASVLVVHHRIPVKPPSLIARVVLVGTAVLFNFVLWDYLYFKARNFPVEALTSSTRTLFYVIKEDREFYGIERDRLAPLEGRQLPDDNVVVILDESIRSDFVSINNPSIGTTPFLRRYASEHDTFINYGATLAATTCSVTTGTMILTGTTVAPDLERAAFSHPTVFQQAKRYGYRTILLDATGAYFPNIVIREPDLKYVDQLLDGENIPGDGRWIDLRVASYVRDLLGKSTGNFVFVVKRGAHFHYENSYPSDDPAYVRFLPKLKATDTYGTSKERTINSYKNAVSFAVDTFFEHLLPAALKNSTIIWTSDHGQSLQEQGQTYTHCKSEFEQAVVPLVVISENAWVLEHLHRPDDRFAFSHHNIYPTLVSLFSRDPEVSNGEYRSLLSATVRQPPLRYVYGPLWANAQAPEVFDVNVKRLRAFGAPR
jgi:glucan phosphoethanolaminetransferase (alkaline phosphatase superfamily)